MKPGSWSTGDLLVIGKAFLDVIRKSGSDFHLRHALADAEKAVEWLELKAAVERYDAGKKFHDYIAQAKWSRFDVARGVESYRGDLDKIVLVVVANPLSGSVSTGPGKTYTMSEADARFALEMAKMRSQ